MAEGALPKRAKPIFPIMYGFQANDVRQIILEIARKKMVTKNDVQVLFEVVDNLDIFISSLWDEKPKLKESKNKLMERFEKTKTVYEQIAIIKEWYRLINQVVGGMYFTEEGYEKYEPHTG